MPTTAKPRVSVILVNPEIPPNTGNIARMCGATSTPLHLVHPLGFSTDDRTLKRAGLDYWSEVEVHHHQSFEEAAAAAGSGPLILFSARSGRPYTHAPYLPGARLCFGQETKGLPRELLEKHSDSVFRIPIWGKVRSLNLSTAAGITVYEAYRQLGALEEEPFIRAGSLPGKLYAPEAASGKKHPCADCFSCQQCSDERCRMCGGGVTPLP